MSSDLETTSQNFEKSFESKILHFANKISHHFHTILPSFAESIVNKPDLTFSHLRSICLIVMLFRMTFRHLWPRQELIVPSMLGLLPQSGKRLKLMALDIQLPIVLQRAPGFGLLWFPWWLWWGSLEHPGTWETLSLPMTGHHIQW